MFSPMRAAMAGSDPAVIPMLQRDLQHFLRRQFRPLRRFAADLNDQRQDVERGTDALTAQRFADSGEADRMRIAPAAAISVIARIPD
ncbi:uncharacterized homolog of PrgY [Paenibacillus popilliae ATCC 14706]|uniref:Uncharacterized homolog of PrgY n=1 Tax=Paenibacillus popilliae ATCC 14706 TaxID=1212764 RepID=M9M503_PAEPP|nr:uncharacterized homolog of PrgY [Paenibacillus popilliae ATCC 14706]